MRQQSQRCIRLILFTKMAGNKINHTSHVITPMMGRVMATFFSIVAGVCSFSRNMVFVMICTDQYMLSISANYFDLINHSCNTLHLLHFLTNQVATNVLLVAFRLHVCHRATMVRSVALCCTFFSFDFLLSFGRISPSLS